ncbi:MAG: hypothetical protein QW057_06660 [Candidatus Bathyarchaeia archaeon]
MKRRGWLKPHVAVDAMAGQFLSMEVTRKGVYDHTMVKPSSWAS